MNAGIPGDMAEHLAKAVLELLQVIKDDDGEDRTPLSINFVAPTFPHEHEWVVVAFMDTAWNYYKYVVYVSPDGRTEVDAY